MEMVRASKGMRLRAVPDWHPRRWKATRAAARRRLERPEPWVGATADIGTRRRRVLAVAIMAHNEEATIAAAVESVFAQQAPERFEVQVIVVANACTARTEAIVRELARRHPHRISLLSVA